MNPKEELLQKIKEALANHTITESDLSHLLTPKEPAPFITLPSLPDSQKEEAESSHKKLNVVDILFYIAGLIMFAAIMVMAFQGGEDMPMMRILITLGAGLLIWTVTYVLGKQPDQTDIRKGLVNSLMLTGCLSVISGAFITVYELIGVNGSDMGYAISVTLVILGIAHLVYDRLFRHIILITLGVALLVGAFPAIIVTLIKDMQVSPDVWALIAIATGVLFGYAGRLASRTQPDRAHLKDSFESLAMFIILGSIYFASLSSSVAIGWEILLPATIYGAFYISIQRRSRNFLVNGALFLVIFLITISFKYFSGLGVAFCLILSAMSLLASAFVAANINKKFIKQPKLQT